MPNSFYRLVDIHIHGDEKVRALTPEPPSGRGLFKHLLICPELGPLPGVIRAGAAALAEVLEWPLESFHACFTELLRGGLVKVDWKAGLIFLVNGIRYTPPNNASQVTGWLRHWNALPDSPLKTVIWERYHAHFLADAERRKREIRAGLRDKKQDPEALLKAYLEHIAQPGQPATVPPPAASELQSSSAPSGSPPRRSSHEQLAEARAQGSRASTGQPSRRRGRGEPPAEIAESLEELANRHEESLRTLDWGTPA